MKRGMMALPSITRSMDELALDNLMSEGLAQTTKWNLPPEQARLTSCEQTFRNEASPWYISVLHFHAYYIMHYCKQSILLQGSKQIKQFYEGQGCNYHWYLQYYSWHHTTTLAMPSAMNLMTWLILTLAYSSYPPYSSIQNFYLLRQDRQFHLSSALSNRLLADRHFLHLGMTRYCSSSGIKLSIFWSRMLMSYEGGDGKNQLQIVIKLQAFSSKATPSLRVEHYWMLTTSTSTDSS